MKQNTQNQLNPEQDLELTFIPDFQRTPMVVTGAYEAVMPVAETIKQLDAAAPVRPVAAVQPAQAVIAPQSAYEDFSTLAPAQVARRKISAFLYDRRNGTNMLDLLNQKIADDRNVAFATKLGLLSVTDTYCQKHMKAVAKLSKLAQ